MVAHARAAAGDTDHRAGGQEGLDVTRDQRILQHLAGRGDDHQACAGRDAAHLPVRPAQDVRGGRQILQPAVGARADECLVDVDAGRLRQGHDVAGLMWPRDHGRQRVEVHQEAFGVPGIRVGVQRAGRDLCATGLDRCAGAGRDPSGQPLEHGRIGGQVSALDPGLGQHVGDDHPALDAEGGQPRPAELQRLVDACFRPKLS